MRDRYEIKGPGRVFLKPGQKIMTNFHIGPRREIFEIKNVRTVEDVPINFSLDVLYRVSPELIQDDLLFSIANLNQGGWETIVQRSTQHILPKLISTQSWQGLHQPHIQQQIERRLTMTLADQLHLVALNISFAKILGTTLPEELQSAVIQEQKRKLERQSRVENLASYHDTVGGDSEKLAWLYAFEELDMLRHKDQLPPLWSGTSIRLLPSLLRAPKTKAPKIITFPAASQDSKAEGQNS
ncbi:MAG: hypothetical protein KDI62_17105 [Anaerolineae bacterium]|nr:hypothetical protein [Anaerolineae bacterium]MCB9106796.1 hypothetical protein [Anaerolineales bacterium]